MSKRPLVETNPYLRKPKGRRALLYTSVSSSTAIEGVHAAFSQALKLPQKPGRPTIIRESEESYRSRR
jgi:hypothetical protein